MSHRSWRVRGARAFSPLSLTAFILLGGTFSACATSLDWARLLEGPEQVSGVCVAVDGSGSVYSIGSFVNTADLDPGPGTYSVTSSGLGDCYVSKLDSEGGFVWARRMGNTTAERCSGLAVDSEGNVYIAGKFADTLDFDLGPGEYNLTAVALDAFVCKLDSNGNFVWAKQVTGTEDASGEEIAVDDSGHVYVAGGFRGVADFDPSAGVLNLASSGEDDIFVMKLDATGNLVWAKAFGGTSFEYVRALAVDDASNVYATGRFRSTADFDPGIAEYNITSLGYDDIFVSKLDPSGDFAWAKAFAGSEDSSGDAIAVDASGNVHIAAQFLSTVDFDPGAGTYNLTSAGSYDVAICKLDSSGNLVWAGAVGGASHDYPAGIAVDSSGSVYTSGQFEGLADFDPGDDFTEMLAQGFTDGFIVKLDSNGIYDWARGIGGPTVPCSVFPSGLAVDPSRHIYFTGQYYGNANFGDFDVPFYMFGSNDAFVVKLKPLTVEVTANVPHHNGTDPVSITVTFSEWVDGFSVDDVAVSNATVANFAGAGTTYTFNLIPIGEATMTVDIPADAAQGYDGDGSVSLSTEFTLNFVALPLVWWPLAIVLLVSGLAVVLSRAKSVRAS